MIIDQINLNHLRIFESVYRSKSMTAAAEELHLTQSGISQHIKTLEESLKVKLFDRVNLKLIPTHAAKVLYSRTTDGLTQIEHALGEIQGKEKEISGTVSVAMPTEFGKNVLIPLFSKISKKYQQLKFNIKFGLPHEISEQLLDGVLDFAFIDSFEVDPRVVTEEIFHEYLILCIHPELLEDKSVKMNKKFFETLTYVDYEKGEPVLRMWFSHHLKQKKLNLNTVAYLSDTHGVGRCIVSGMGAGVIPEHLIEKFEAGGVKLYRFKGMENPLHNTISLAYLQDRTHSAASYIIQKELKSSLQSLK